MPCSLICSSLLCKAVGRQNTATHISRVNYNIMMKISPVIEPTADGSSTLRHPVFGETYHSVRGALGESMHVFIRNGLEKIDKPFIRVLEVGFGTGLNAWLTLEHSRRNDIAIEYHAIEPYPISADTGRMLGYTRDPLFMALHEAPWNRMAEITPLFSIAKSECDLESAVFSAKFDMIYFDAFSPEVQPSLWEPGIFSTLYQATGCGGILTTYSARGSVKRALREAGFRVERLPGALGKRHMLRAVKDPENSPLQ